MEKIKIIYDIKQKVEFSFWKYFFELAGIWVTSERYDMDHIFTRYEETKKIYVLSYDSEKMIPDKSNNDICYIVRKKSRKVDDSRNDLCRADWGDKLKFNKVVSWLYKEKAQKEELLSLLKAYCECNMWKYLWLFQEFSLDAGDIDRWGREIINVSQNFQRKIRTQLDKKRNMYADYANLYCQYIILAIAERLDGGKSEAIGRLAENVVELHKRRIDDSALYILLAKICSLNVDMNQWIKHYYERALKYNETYELLYKMGRIYEKGYGNWDKAIQYYHASYEVNPDFYRAVYKLGVEAEKGGRWKDAATYYYQLEKCLDDDLQYDQVSIKPMEYSCKVWNRMRYIYNKIVSVAFMGHIYSKKLGKIEANLDKYVSELEKEEGKTSSKSIEIIGKFGKFFHCAGFNNEEIIKIMFIIKKKIQSLEC